MRLDFNIWIEEEKFVPLQKNIMRSLNLQLSKGIPFHDAFYRFFSALDPEEIEQAFIHWGSDVAGMTNGEIVKFEHIKYSWLGNKKLKFTLVTFS
jgi:hypothetical protein